MACLNCKTLRELMNREVGELQGRENQLKWLNRTLQEAVLQAENKQHNLWKGKY